MSEEQPGGILPRLPPALAERMTQVFRRVAGLDPQLNIRDVIDQVGVDYDAALRLWRAFGMPIVDPHQRQFDEQDVQSMRAFRALLDAGISIEEIMGVARVWGQAFSRIAEVEQRLFRKEFIDPLLRQRTSQREAEEIPEILEPLSRTLLDLLDGLLRNAHRRYLDMAV